MRPSCIVMDAPLFDDRLGFLGQGASAAGVALRFKENAAGRGGCVPSGREEGAGGCVGEGAVPGEAEHTDLRAAQQAKASPKLSQRGIPASERGTVKA